MAVFSPELQPLPEVTKLRHDYSANDADFGDEDDDGSFFAPGLEGCDDHEENVTKAIFKNKISKIPNSSFHSIPSQMGPLIHLPEEKVKLLPRQKLIMETRRNEPKKRTSKMRKKIKFRLIPTLKNLENGNFIGRQTEIKHIRRLLVNTKVQNSLDEHNSLSMLALTGSPAVGKTSIAYLYLLTYERRYKYVFWIKASSILSDIRDILLYHLKNKYEVQSIKSEKSAEVIRLRFLNYLSSLEDDWLLIVDDYDNTTIDVTQFIPENLEQVKSCTLKKLTNGHILITSNMLFKKLEEVFRSHNRRLLNLHIKELPRELILPYIKSQGPTTAKDEEVLLSLLKKEELNNDVFALKLLKALHVHYNLPWHVVLTKYKTEIEMIKFQRMEKLKSIFREVRENELKNKKKKKFYYTRQQLMNLLKLKQTKTINLMDLDGFNSSLFEIELVLQRFKLLKYFKSMILNNITSVQQMSEVDLSNSRTFYWVNLRYKSKKRGRTFRYKKLPFNARDEDKFLQLTQYIQRQQRQRRINAIMRLWLDLLTSSKNQQFDSKILEILRQCSHLGEARIPMFLFPELLLEDSTHSEDANNSLSNSSTITHNSNALSSLNLNIQVNTKINGSSRFMSSELQYFNNSNNVSFLNFLVLNDLLKLEKTGFVSMNALVKHAIMNITDNKFETIIALLRKIHIIGFEFNFENIVGESLALLRNNPKLVQNSYNKVDIKFIQSLSDVELQKFCVHDYNLKLNMIPHIEYVRRVCFKALLADKRQLKEYTSHCLAPKCDLFGIRHKYIKDFNKYVTLMTHNDKQPMFNASRASLFPDFSNRDLTLVRADIIFNEGLFILNVPFRKTRLLDAFNCFKTSYNLFSHVLSNKRLLNGRDLTMSKCCYQMAEALYEMKQFLQSLRVFELCLTHFHDFHGEFTNHPDTARTLSAIGKVYLSLAIAASRREATPLDDLLKVNVKDILPRNNSSDESITPYQQEVVPDVEELVKKYDVDALVGEALRHQQLALQMYMDILGKRPLNAAFAASLTSRAKTFLLMSDFAEAEQDLEDALSIYEKLAESAVTYKSELAEVALLLARVAFETNDNLEEFMKYLNMAMLAYSSLSSYEITLCQNSKCAEICDETALTDVNIAELNPHPMLSESLVQAAEILLDAPQKQQQENAIILLQAACAKYREIFGKFKHPRLSEIRQRLKSL